MHNFEDLLFPFAKQRVRYNNNNNNNKKNTITESKTQYIKCQRRCQWVISTLCCSDKAVIKGDAETSEGHTFILLLSKGSMHEFRREFTHLLMRLRRYALVVNRRLHTALTSFSVSNFQSNAP